MVRRALMIISLVSVGFFPSFVLADHSTEHSLCQGAGGTFNPASKTCSEPPGQSTLESGFGDIINALIFIVGAVSVLMLIVGAVRFVTSAGDENAVKGARNTILYAIIGIVVALLAFAIVNFVILRIAPPAA